jgi:hypothetical protein
MKSSEAKALRMRWGNKPCDHPFLEIERDEVGSSAGDYVCTQCGQARAGSDWNEKTGNYCASPKQPPRFSSAKILLVAFFLALPFASLAQFNYVNNNGAITITGYTGSGGLVVIPDQIDFLPVTRIETNAFYSCTNITSLTISVNVKSIGAGAFN